MRRPTRQLAPLFVLAFAASGAWASKRPFSINEDLLAFPQYQVIFPKEYILHSQAEELLQSQTGPSSDDRQSSQGQNTPQVYPAQDRADTDKRESDKKDRYPFTYEEMILNDRRLLCQIPRVTQHDSNTTASAQHNKAEEQKELARATDRGLELLREMEGKCMYYYSGWWSYSFCYMKQIKQFHALSAGGGIPHYPPVEDTSTHSFVLGKFPHSEDGDGDGDGEQDHQQAKTDVAELHTKGGSRYLVQHLQGGTKCDLTGRERQVEVQFHCYPQSTDQIGWIKELTTCSYLMVIYTPRLCDDVAFLPPQQNEAHTIECREVLMPEEVSEWEAVKQWYLAHDLPNAAAADRETQIVGGVEVGGQKLVGMEGKQIEKGRVASAGEERVEVIAKRENGEVLALSKKELKKYEKYKLNREKLDELIERLEEYAKGKDWTLEAVEGHGKLDFRGFTEKVEDAEGGPADATPKKPSPEDSAPQTQQQRQDEESQPSVDESKAAQQKSSKQDGPAVSEDGSEETFKDEL